MSRLEWRATLRAARLSAVKDKLDREMQLRKSAEEALASAKPRLHLIDEVLPTMVVLIDHDERCRYHNKAFSDWLHVRPEHLQGEHLRKILGPGAYEEIEPAVRQSLEGYPARYQRTQSMPDGAVYRLLVEHLPQFAGNGKVTGFYMLMHDITTPGDVHTPGTLQSARPAVNASRNAAAEVSGQDAFVDSFSAQISGERGAEPIKAAIEKGDFRLFSQEIAALGNTPPSARHLEVLVRLREEEEGMMPPGAFFPLAEKYGLMPQLDRWVVQHVVEWASGQGTQNVEGKGATLFINVSSATIADAGFPQFLQSTLANCDVAGGALCFEIPASEFAAKPADVAEFVRRIGQCGCRIAISGFGRDNVSFDLLKGIRVDFLKIDGSIIFNILRDPVQLAKITAINKVTKRVGVKTVAELVEDEDTVAKLKEVGTDFAQGFGVSMPQPLV